MNISFLDLFNASISASWLVLVVIGLRFVLKKAPKSIHCALWALVAVRLLCPFTIESEFSLVPSSQTVSPAYLLEPAVHSNGQAVLDIVDNPIYPESVNMVLDSSVSRVSVWDIEWSMIWLVGVSIMAAYVLISWLRLRRKVAVSIPIGSNIRLCDHIDSPFILGVFRPRIYLPSDMDQKALDHVLAHEQAHLARRDHWWKPLGFLLLTIHWFNPIMWLAYILLCRDIELACDEKVIKDLDPTQKKAYSTALLTCSVSRPMIAACPLAFGEVGVKERVKNVLNYKKPAFWVIVVAVILCGVVAVCFLTDPPAPDVYDVMYQNGYTVLNQRDHYLDISIPADVLPEEAFSAEGYSFDEKEVIVFQTDTTSIRLMHVQYANEGSDKMYFEFSISHDLPRSGSILLSSRVKVGTHTSSGHFQPTSSTLYDGETSFDDAVSIRAHGPGQRFTVYIDTAAARAAQEELRFNALMNELTYVKGGRHVPEVIPSESLAEGTYVSQEKLFWSWVSSLYVEGITMDVNDDVVTISYWENPNWTEGPFPLGNEWQQACPIDEVRRQILAELFDIESIFAFNDLQDCRFLVLDSTHFIAESDGELYLVSWRHSMIHLEMIEYIFHMVPVEEYEYEEEPIQSAQVKTETVTVETPEWIGFEHVDLGSESTEEAIRQYFLDQNTTNSGFTAVSYQSYGQMLSAKDNINHLVFLLAVRVAHYSQNDDGSITEDSFELLPVQLWLAPTDGDTLTFVDCTRDDADYSANAFVLEVDCWNQAMRHFGQEPDRALETLEDLYPDYFTRDTAKGLDVLWWNTDDGVRCVIMNGLNRRRTVAEARNQPPLTVPEAMAILDHYDVPVNAMLAMSSNFLEIYRIEEP